MDCINDKESIVNRVKKAVEKTFPDAKIDSFNNWITCTYGDVGLWAHMEGDGKFTVEVNYPFPVIEEDDLPNDWFYFKMEFVSSRLEEIAKQTLLKNGHGWQEICDFNEGCLADSGGASISLNNNDPDTKIDIVVHDIDAYFKESRNNLQIDKAAQVWFVAKCVKMGLESPYKLSRPLSPLKEWQEHLINNDKDILGGSRNDLIPVKFLNQKRLSLSQDKLAIGEKFHFIEYNRDYFAYYNYPISFAHYLLSLAVEPMKDLSPNYQIVHEIDHQGLLLIQLKGTREFSPWFLLHPCDLLSAKVLEPKEPIITKRAGLLRLVLGESKVPNINFLEMTDEEFEELCCKLLMAKGAIDIEKRGSSRSRDGGVDISCKFESSIVFGKEVKAILVQCKKLKRNFGMSDYDKLHWPELLRINQADKFILMCTSAITKDVSELAYASMGKLQIMDGIRLSQEIAKYPEVLIKDK